MLEKAPSNLGKGFKWYFRCPFTDKLCMKLYLHNGTFMHRRAIKGGMYSKQTYSKNDRRLIQQYEKLFLIERLYEKLCQPYAKKYYKGKPTKLATKTNRLEIDV